MLSAAGGCELSTTTHDKTAVFVLTIYHLRKPCGGGNNNKIVLFLFCYFFLSFYIPDIIYWNYGQLGPKISRPRTTRPIKRLAQDNSAQIVPISEDFFFFFFFDLGFTALSRIFHLYRADRSSKVGENRRTRRKTT